MRYVIIAAFDTTLMAFMPPQAVNEMLDEDIVESNRRAVLNGTIPSDKAKRLVVYKFGTFDDIKGVFATLDQPEKLCSLGSFLPRAVVEEVKTSEIQN